MSVVRYGIVGVGNMGSSHLRYLSAGKIEGAVLTALCDINPEKLEIAKKYLEENQPDLKVSFYEDYKTLFASGEIDAVIIATPHYLHPTIGIDAFAANLHVLSEKPIGVYTKQVLELYEAAKKSDRVFGIMYNQRTNPLYQKVREMIKNGELGELKRCIWIITSWYRTQAYYNSGGWRATWKGEGGGVMANQCPHQLDLWQWMFGMPETIRASCYEGKYHDIEVEDDVTAFAEYANGATGVFITTTGEAPGTNRLEISGDRGKIVVENDTLTFTKLATPEREFCYTCQEGFSTPQKETSVIEVPKKPDGFQEHQGITQNFTNAILKGEELLAPGLEGINGLQISNAMYLSSWTDKTIKLPVDPDVYFEYLNKKIENSTFEKKNVKETIANVSGTYHV
ncbi:MAG: Gfo/Idh/MocA family oxidoreductase [Clostridia bacterium]|nr:Gfo/Idh/MocA family oxidoreductase [Clostridia bacterium]